MKFIVLTLKALGMLVPAYSQTVKSSNSQWNLDGFSDNLRRMRTLKSKFIPRKDKLVRRECKNESFVHTVEISSGERLWADVKRNGVLIRDVIFDKRPGTRKSGPTVSPNVNFQGMGREEFNHDFSISSFRIL
jgi:hypothetical protein